MSEWWQISHSAKLSKYYSSLLPWRCECIIDLPKKKQPRDFSCQVSLPKQLHSTCYWFEFTSSHWSLNVSMSFWMEHASELGTLSSSLCRSSTVLMSWSMSSCFSLSSAWTISCCRDRKEFRRNGDRPLEGDTLHKLKGEIGFVVDMYFWLVCRKNHAHYIVIPVN